MNTAASSALTNLTMREASEAVPRHLLHVFSTFALGGPQKRLAALARHFAGRFRHSIIALDGRSDATLLTQAIPNCTMRAGAPWPKQPGSQVLPAWRALRALRPDLLVTYNWGAMEWSAANLLAGIPHIHIEDGFGPEEAGGQIPRRVWFRRLVLNRRSTVVMPSRTLVQLALDCWRIAPERIAFIPNGIPWSKFQVAVDLGLKARFKGAGPVIGTVAALRKEKALERLIDAHALVAARRPARLVIAGDGAERAKLEAYAARHGRADSITFTGNVDAPERLLACFDLFALSSDTEQMPLSVLEAMAGGRAIAGTDVGDVRTMVALENRRFIGPIDAKALSESILELLDNHTLRRAAGESNRQRARAEFDESRMFMSYERLFIARNEFPFLRDVEGAPLPAPRT